MKTDHKPTGWISFLPSIPQFCEKCNYYVWKFLCSGTVPYTSQLIFVNQLWWHAHSVALSYTWDQMFSGTLEGSWKPQPGCKRKADWEGASVCVVCICLPFKIHLNHICTFLEYASWPRPLLPMPLSVPGKISPHLLQLANFHSSFKGCSSNNPSLPKTIWHLFCYRLSSNNILSLQSIDLHLNNCVII